ncbi:MAG: matrixin family metalloprotease [Phycisphaerae bacterium]|nr:matrixin family metalloprotease [Phycisphaerae bacterium]
MTMRRLIGVSLFLLVGTATVCLLSGQGCPPPPPPKLPALTACGSYGGSCQFDLLPSQPNSVVSYRPAIRWPTLDLTWSLVTPCSSLDQQDQIAEIQRAFDAWAAVSTLSFTRVERDGDIVVSFETGDLGDGSRFASCGESCVELGRAFFPGTARQGLVQLNGNEPWCLQPDGGKRHLLTTLLHEIGHALGLDHVSSPTAVMAPENTGICEALTAADISAIQSLYGSADGTIPPLAVTTPGNLPPAPGSVGPATSDTDSDGDGIPNAMEILALDTDPYAADSDGDGEDDYTEFFVNGTPPAANGVAPSRNPVAHAHALYPAIQTGWINTLDGRLSQDPFGLPLLYGWRQLDGPEVVLNASNTAQPSFTAPRISQDTWVEFELTVSNSRGTDTDTVSVLILSEYAPTTVSTADAGPNQVAYEGRQVELDGSGSVDPNHLTLSYSWSQTSGADVSLSNSAAATTTFTAPSVQQETQLEFQLTVSNGSSTASDSVTILVRPLNADTDQDGITDGDELYFLGTDPNQADTDGDGVLDGQDQSPTNARFQ